MGEQGSGSAAAAAEPRVRLSVAVLAVLATVVVALLLVALVVRLDADRLPAAAPRDPPAAPPEATTFSVDGTRTARLQEFSARLPGAPYGCGDTQTPPTGFTTWEACSTVVHADYDPAGHDWSAIAGVLLLDDSLVRPGDLKATTTAAFDALVGQLYSPADHATLSKVATDDVRLPVPADRVSSRLADVDVKVEGLATPYDRLAVIVVRLDSGRHVVYFSDFPHDGSKEALTALGVSVSSISVQG